MSETEQVRIGIGKGHALLALARLASERLHERYIDGATVDEYLLPHELVGDVDSSLIWMSHPANRAAFSDREIERFASVLKVVDDNYDQAERQMDAATRGPVAQIEEWVRIQKAAAEALAEFGIEAHRLSLEELEADNLDWLQQVHWEVGQ